MEKKWIIIIFLAIAFTSLLIHLPHFKKDLISIHVWRQTQTQTTIDNFYEEDFNILNPRRNSRGSDDGIFRMEFPLMQWIVAGLYKIFGSSIVLTRVFMFITGLFSILGIFFLLKLIFKNNTAGIIGALALCFSPSFYYYTINPLPDNFALCFAIWGAYYNFKWIYKSKTKNLIIGSFLFSIAALCKLPFVLYWSIPISFLTIQLARKNIKIKAFLKDFSISVAFIILPFSWYITVISGWEGNGIVSGMLENSSSSSEIFEYLSHNLVSVLPELLINYAALPFFLLGIFKIFKNKSFKSNHFYIYAIWGLSILAYFFFEINMIAKIHDYYLFPFYPLLIILIVSGALNMIYGQKRTLKYIAIALLLLLPITAYVRMHVRWNEDNPGFNKDLLIHKNDLQSSVPDDALCVVGNDISHHIFFYYIHKKGWCFEEDYLTGSELHKMINDGAEYLYTDSEVVMNNPEIIKLCDENIANYGSIYVWKLKQ